MTKQPDSQTTIMKCPRCGVDRESCEPDEGCRDPECPAIDGIEDTKEAYLYFDDGDPHHIPYLEATLRMMGHCAAILNIEDYR